MLVVFWIYKSLGNRCVQKPFKNVNLQLKNDMAINIPANYYLHESKHGLEKSIRQNIKSSAPISCTSNIFVNREQY